MLAGGNFPPVCRMVFPLDPLLSFLEIVRDRWTCLVSAGEAVPIPFHDSDIKFILKDPKNCSAFKRTVSSGFPSTVITVPGDLCHIQPIMIGLKDIFDRRITFFINNERFSSSDCLIPQRWDSLVTRFGVPSRSSHAEPLQRDYRSNIHQTTQ